MSETAGTSDGPPPQPPPGWYNTPPGSYGAPPPPPQYGAPQDQYGAPAGFVRHAAAGLGRAAVVRPASAVRLAAAASRWRQR